MREMVSRRSSSSRSPSEWSEMNSSTSQYSSAVGHARAAVDMRFSSASTRHAMSASGPSGVIAETTGSTVPTSAAAMAAFPSASTRDGPHTAPSPVGTSRMSSTPTSSPFASNGSSARTTVSSSFTAEPRSTPAPPSISIRCSSGTQSVVTCTRNAWHAGRFTENIWHSRSTASENRERSFMCESPCMTRSVAAITSAAAPGSAPTSSRGCASSSSAGPATYGRSRTGDRAQSRSATTAAASSRPATNRA